MDIRIIVSFKMDELRYAKRTKKILKFIFSNVSKEKRKSFFENYLRRGLYSANSMGVNVPLGFPIGSLCEVFFDKIYDMDGFIPKKEDTVIDVGAHTGDWTIYCAKVLQVNKIYGFEPLMDNVTHANSILSVNKCNNATIYQIALSDQDKEAVMEYNGTMLGEIKIGSEKKVETIQFRRLDSFNLKCDLLKIDVEGFELEVLKGSIETIRKYRPKIILETHTKKLRNECNNFLESEGYNLKITGRMLKGYNDKLPSGFDEVVNLFYQPRTISNKT